MCIEYMQPKQPQAPVAPDEASRIQSNLNPDLIGEERNVHRSSIQ